MKINENPSGTTGDGGGRAEPRSGDTCPNCNAVFAAMDAAGIQYEVLTLCAWCGIRPADTSPDMDGCCGEDCRYALARDEGWISDSEHAANLLEGWAS